MVEGEIILEYTVVFYFQHPKAETMVREDGILQRCELCGMFNKNIEKHQRPEMCKKGQKRREHEKKDKTSRERQMM